MKSVLTLTIIFFSITLHAQLLEVGRSQEIFEHRDKSPSYHVSTGLDFKDFLRTSVKYSRYKVSFYEKNNVGLQAGYIKYWNSFVQLGIEIGSGVQFHWGGAYPTKQQTMGRPVALPYFCFKSNALAYYGHASIEVRKWRFGLPFQYRIGQYRSFGETKNDGGLYTCSEDPNLQDIQKMMYQGFSFGLRYYFATQ